MYVNDLPQHTTTSSAVLLADDTKCYHAIKGTQDVQDLQRDMDGINQWCRLWGMTLNKSKCGVLIVTRKVNPGNHWFNDYSSNRTQRVVNDYVVSQYLPVASGLARESIGRTSIIFRFY